MKLKNVINYGMSVLRSPFDRYAQYVYKNYTLPALNAACDITNCPKAKGKLRKLQIADTLLLKFFHDICIKNNIRYFLKDGTLLGAVRHGGFIPWDDDLDTQILAEDFDKTVSILESEIKGTQLELWGVEKTRFGNATLRISHKDFPQLNLDIFYLHASERSIMDAESIHKLWSSYRKTYYTIYRKLTKHETREAITHFRKSIDEPFEKDIRGTNSKLARSYTNQISSDFQCLDANWIFPLKPMKFEDFEFMVPNNCHAVLSAIYGNYMSFPPNFNHHGSWFSSFEESSIDPIIGYLESLLQPRGHHR